MTIEEFRNLSEYKLKSMQEKDPEAFKKMVQTMGSRLNKRYHNIRSNKAEYAQDAVRVMESSGGSFKTTVREDGKRRAMTDYELLKEAMREKRFANSKTGTVAGARSTRKLQAELFGQNAKEYATQQRQAYKEQHPRATTKELNKVYKDNYREYSDAVGEAWDLYHNAQKRDPNLKTNDWSEASDVPSVIDYVVQQHFENPGGINAKDIIDNYIEEMRSRIPDKKAPAPWEVNEIHAYS